MATEKKPDWIFWTLIGLVVLWIILKLAGVINTPTLVEVFPFTALVAITVYMHQLHDKRHDKIDTELAEHNRRISILEQKFISAESKLDLILDLLKSKTK